MVFLLNINCCNINQDGSISQGIFTHVLENKKVNFIIIIVLIILYYLYILLECL